MLAQGYSHHTFKFLLADGSRVMWNRIQGYSIEVEGMYLRAATDAEALEIAQIIADDDAAFAEECELDKEASVANTELW